MIGLQPGNRLGKPRRVAQRRLADPKRGAGSRPGSKLGTDALDEGCLGNREAKPQSRQSVNLAERPQNDRRRRQLGTEARRFRKHVDKGFVDDE